MALGTAMAVAVAAALWLALQAGTADRERGAPPGPRRQIDPTYAGYVGDTSCRDCHPGEYAAHTGSGHSKTLRPAARVALRRHWDGLTAWDPERPGVAWTYHLRDGRLWTERSRTDPGPSTGRAGSETERFVIDYAFGSGWHATTLVSLLDRDPRRPIIREHRLTFFAHSATPGLTPGLSLGGHASGNTETGRVHSTEQALQCFGCHVTATSDRGPDLLDETTMIPNITCERCHGPARAHVAAARRDARTDDLRMPFGLEGTTAADQIRLCGSCHRTPEMVTSGAITTANPIVVRYQPVGLIQSACFKGSNGSLGCTQCHDPHARSSTDTAAYEAVCRSCHEGPKRTTCPVNPGAGCVGCHMPRRETTRGMKFTDHWIRIRPVSEAENIGKSAK
jgi:hypothetical protein